MTFAELILEDEADIDEVAVGPENAEDEGGDDAYISGMDTLNDDEHPDNLTYIDIAVEASAYGWDRETEAKVRQLADKLERMPTSDEIARALEG